MGALHEEQVVAHWRVTTRNRTTDELGLLLLDLLRHQGMEPERFKGVAVSCVVPSILYAIEKACRRYLDQDPMFVGRGIRTGMRVRTDNPREVGADRIVNAVAAFHRYNGPLVVVDFGTATTFDCVNAEGDYLGGAIAPGFQISADALFQRTAKLPRVELGRPAKAIGTNTILSMQSGLFWGYVGLVDELARRCKAELDGEAMCVATGGMAKLVGGTCTEIHKVDDWLTLEGLRLLWELNHGGRSRE
ncbi:MAG: type III pantothenate kinase [Myxococcota bacterium]|nr:type III pantothenate kinase [Myxococcota bacterium]